jgi:type III restriction enzyme
VHDINVLTVIASESYEDFAKGLQDEMAAALKGRPREASRAYFTGKTIQTEAGPHEISQAEANILHRWLMKNDYIDENDRIQPAWHEAREGESLADLPAELAAHAAAYVALVDTVFDESALKKLVGDGRRMVPLQVRRANLDKRAFQELWSRINQKAVYFTDFDTPLLVQRAIRRLDLDLKVDHQVIIVSGAELRADVALEDIRRGTGFSEEKTRFEHRAEKTTSRVRYDLVGDLANGTRLTRATAGAILQGISPKTFALFGQNPEMFLRGAAELIRREKIALAIETLRYEKTGENYDVSIFQTDRSDISLNDALATKKHVYDHVAVDSTNERTFAERLEAAEEVIVYAKLPRGFVIPTPGGG